MTGLLLLAALAIGQEADDRWFTAETENFRVHYPASAEEWGLEAAGTLEEIRVRVNEEVGWTPTRKMDVVIVDPYGQANGSAWPFVAHPRMLLWATPPAPDSGIGHYRSWGELLLTHEYAHMVHLLRTSRSPVGQVIERGLGIAPITRKAPRWCIEGYATVVEARLSGFGRPNTDARALLLRRLAQQGKFPTYGELNSFDRFYGGSFAYLVGSAYLEWLEARTGEGSLRDLWARLTAAEDRGFDDAFTGVFGDPPDVLYARFTAEVAGAAMQIEASRPVDSDTLWMDTSWYTGGPVVSPDGTKLAAVTSQRDKPSVLRIWSLDEDDQEAIEERAEAMKEAAERDPDDVPAVDPKHPPRKELHSRTFLTRSASSPRWMPDGSGLLFTAWQPRSDGRMGPDLFVWEPESGDERRVTVGKDVRLADPFPDGRRALAVRQDWGRTHLVVVDLVSGEIEALTEPTLDVLYDQPRVAPVGDRVAWLEHSGDGWAIVIHDREEQERWRIGGTPGGIIPTHLAWSPDGESLFASVGQDGFVEIHEVWGTDGARGQLTRTRGGAIQPSASDDALFYLSADADGFEIHRLAFDQVVADVPVESVAPVVRPAWSPGPEAPARVEVESSRYGAGRTEWRPLLGGTWSRSQAAIEAGIRLGDIVGKRDLLLMGSYGRNTGITGGLLGFEYRGLPIDLTAQGFVAMEPPELMRRFGGLFRLSNGYSGSAAALDWRLAGSYDQAFAEREREDGAIVDVPPERMIGTAEISAILLEPRRALARLDLRFRGQVGATGGEPWSRSELASDVGLGRKAGVRAGYTVGVSDAVSPLDQYRLGGVHSSVLPDEWQWQRIDAAVFDLGAARGANRDELSVALGAPGTIALVGERHRMSDDVTALGAQGTTAVNLEAGFDTEAVPFQRLPDGSFEAGLGCRVEDPIDGWAENPCQTVDDYAFWLQVRWTL